MVGQRLGKLNCYVDGLFLMMYVHGAWSSILESQEIREVTFIADPGILD